MNKRFKFFYVLAWLVMLVITADAYAPQFADETGNLRLHWKNGTIKIALSKSLTQQNFNIRPGSDVTDAIERSLDAWEKAANIKFQVIWTDKQSASPAGNSGDGISLITIAQTPENLLPFGSDADEVSAITRTFYNRKGFITEADIILNPYQQFSTDGAFGTFDLEATLTHELGHLLGLEHSFILGATMHAHQQKNGIYNLPGFASRTLSEDDVAGIRALYGANLADENCCGAISGKLSLANGKAAKEFQVWAEESETGRVFAGVLTGADGSFRIEGLQSGNYQLYSRKTSVKSESVFAVEDLDEIEITKGKTTTLTKKISNLPKLSGNLQYTGFQSQLSGLAVPVNAGKSFVIYLGGKNFNPDTNKIKLNSPYITITPNSFNKHPYDAGISAVSFEVKVDSRTPAGEYSIFIQDANGTNVSLIGCLSVDKFENPWNSSILLGNN